MKTIIDAVNELRGDLGNSHNGCAIGNSLVLFGKSNYKFYTADAYYGMCGWSQICTIEEFNAMVAEMSEGFEEYKREYEMDKTVTVDGMAYELGGLYKSQCGDIVGLLSVDMGRFTCVVLGGGRQSYERITALTMDSLGTITPAPVELVDGEWYMCECGIMSSRVNKPLLNIGKDDWSVNSCRVRSNLINVKPLYKMIQEVK